MSEKFETSAKQATGPFVVAVDVGSTGTRGCLFDARGLPVKDTKVKFEHAFTSTADGASTIDPDQVADEIARCLDFVCEHHDGPIDGVALDTFASSLVGVDATGAAITPCFTYADSRPAAQVAQLRTRLDEDATQQRTGTRQHTGYQPARFLWLQQTQPEVFAAATRWMSLGEYAWLKLIGSTAAGTSTAAWTGMLNRREGRWDEELCALAGVKASQLSQIANPEDTLAAGPKAARRWPALADARWFAPVTDGFSSCLGVGATTDSQMVLAAATSGALRVLVPGDLANLPTGLWCYRIDAARSVLGGALNDVGRAVSWLEQTVQVPAPEELEAAMTAEPSPTTPLVLPWFTGERSTGWDGQARAEFHGVSITTTGTQLYRGTMEGVALSYQRAFAQLVQASGRPREILASGRVVQDHPWLMQILADVLEVSVTPVTIKRSTLRGTALQALDVLAPSVERSEPTRGETLRPTPGRADYYRERATAFQSLHERAVQAR